MQKSSLRISVLTSLLVAINIHTPVSTVNGLIWAKKDEVLSIQVLIAVKG